MKKYLVSILFVIAFAGIVGYSYFNKRENLSSNSEANGTLSTTIPNSTSNADTENNQTSQTSSTPNSNSGSSSSNETSKDGVYKNGTYTGNVADAFYGNVQVQADISNGQLTSVQFLQYPDDAGDSRRINSRAIPMLESEAIQAQSANVDIISGATQTSEAFRESLSNALRTAKA